MNAWTQSRLRYVADLNPSIRADLLDAPQSEVSFLPMEAIGDDGSLNLGRTRPVDEVRNGYSYFENGDVVFAKVTPCFENGKRALMQGLVLGAGFGTTEITVLRPKHGMDARYLNYVVQSERFKQLGIGAMTGAGGLKRVPDDFTRDFSFACPSPKEQERIANFLDEKTARIDALIAEKEWMLATLASAREAHAFALTTSGIESDCNRVGRPEPWLPNVPTHWTVPKLGYIAEVGNGSTPRREVEKYWVDGTIPWITSTAIHDGIIGSTNEKITQEALADCHLRMVRPGSSIVGLIGQGPTRGMTARLGISATLSQNVAFASARQSTQVDDEYLTICLTGLYSAMRYLSDGVGGAQGAMNCDQLRAIRVPLPPLVEQRAIAAEFRKREAALEGLLGHASEHIDRLREYRSSLISAAVTGQLDVAAFKDSGLEAA